ncbi:Mor transcription activator family protein [Azonexus sp.]|uniref:Mor transcription activator family protein n=1 Tax=Azonexus sp. TaxID=1872668 RepID=UPI0039E3F80B
MVKHSATAVAGELAVCEMDLPPSARDLVRWVGWQGAISMIREMPGARIYSPKRGPQHSQKADARYARVAELAGEHGAAALYRAIAGGIFEVPRCAAAMARARNRDIRRAFDAGVNVEELCYRYGVSRRSVYYILKGGDDPEAMPLRQSGQGVLF